MTASITVDTTNIIDGDILDAADITLPINQLKTSLEDVLNGVQAFDRISFGTAEALTISSGVISTTKTHIVVDTEASAATDDLDTINTGVQGRWIVVRSTNNSRTVKVKHATGNIRTTTGQDISLSSTDMWALLIHNGTNWLATIMPTSNAVQINTSRTVVVSNVGSVTISNIPATYKHLLLILEIRTDAAATNDNLILRFNADSTAANYYTQYFVVSGTTVSAAEILGATTTGILLPFSATGNTGSAGNGIALVWIYNYASITMRRIVDSRSGALAALSTTNVKKGDTTGFWNNTSAAITSITWLPQVGTNIVTNSAYTLYGFN